MIDQTSNLWHTHLNVLLAAETEQAALEAAVAAAAELLNGPAVGILKGRTEHASSVSPRGQDRLVSPLFVEALWQSGLRLASKHQPLQELLDDHRLIALPLHANDEVIGAICALSGAVGVEQMSSLNVLELAFVRTVQRLRRLAETQLLYQISLRLSNTMDLPRLMQEVLEMTMATFAAKESRVFLADDRNHDLVMMMSPAAHMPAVEAQRLPLEGTIAGWVIQQSTGVIRNDSHDGRFPLIEQETGLPQGKLMCVPLKQADRTLGALMLVNQHDDPDFLEEDLRLLTTIAGTIAIMIANARLYQRAIRDALTGAYNRGAFDNALAQHWTKWEQSGTGFALLMLDLDDFKQVNDRFGHSIGDTVLQAVTRLLWEALRQEDGIFRYGGEEFCVLLSDLTNVDLVVQIAERVRAVLDREMAINNLVSVKISASIGAALHPLHRAHSMLNLLNLADGAAYQAKRTGKNRVVVASFDQDLTTFSPYGT